MKRSRTAHFSIRPTRQLASPADRVTGRMYSGPQKRFDAAHCKHELDGVPGNCLVRPFVVNYRKETGGTFMGLCQATCPHCRTLLLFPQEWRGLLLRCKTCLQVFRETNVPIPTGQVIPAAGSPTNGGTVPGGPVEGRNNLTNFSPPNGGVPAPAIITHSRCRPGTYQRSGYARPP
jgi:hypothetical protein